MGILFLYNDHWENKQLVIVWQGWMGVKWRQWLWARRGTGGVRQRAEQGCYLGRLRKWLAERIREDARVGYV